MKHSTLPCRGTLNPRLPFSNYPLGYIVGCQMLKIWYYCGTSCQKAFYTGHQYSFDLYRRDILSLCCNCQNHGHAHFWSRPFPVFENKYFWLFEWKVRRLHRYFICSKSLYDQGWSKWSNPNKNQTQNGNFMVGLKDWVFWVFSQKMRRKGFYADPCLMKK